MTKSICAVPGPQSTAGFRTRHVVWSPMVPMAPLLLDVKWERCSRDPFSVAAWSPFGPWTPPGHLWSWAWGRVCWCRIRRYHKRPGPEELNWGSLLLGEISVSVLNEVFIDMTIVHFIAPGWESYVRDVYPGDLQQARRIIRAPSNRLRGGLSAGICFLVCVYVNKLDVYGWVGFTDDARTLHALRATRRLN